MKVSWLLFIDTLSDEFVHLTGFGVYAHIDPIEICKLYEQFQEQAVPLREFLNNHVRHNCLNT